MITKILLKPSEYHDSVSLMLVARELSGLEGVQALGDVRGSDWFTKVKAHGDQHQCQQIDHPPQAFGWRV